MRNTLKRIKFFRLLGENTEKVVKKHEEDYNRLFPMPGMNHRFEDLLRQMDEADKARFQRHAA